jgi:WD40 repeat protein
MNPLVLRAGHADTQALAFRPDGRVLATCAAQESTLHFWRVRDGALLGVFAGHPKLRRFALSQNRLLTFGPSRVRLWRTTLMDRQGFDFELLAEYAADSDRLVLNSRHFLFRQAGSQVALGDIQEGKIKHTYPEARWFYTGERGRRVLLGAEKSYLYSGVSGRQVGELEVGCAMASFSPEDRWLACAGLNDSKVTLVDTESLQIWPLEAHRQRVLMGAFSTDGLWFASVAEDATLCLVNLEDWRMTLFSCQFGPATLLQWLCGNRVVVGDAAGVYQVFQATRGGVQAHPKQSILSTGERGAWCAGPDSLAAWAPRGQSVRIHNLSESIALSQLAPPLRSEVLPPQKLVGQAVLVGTRPWSLSHGRPLTLEGECQPVSDFLVGRRGARYQMLDGFSFQALPASELLAICPEALRFAFYLPESSQLQVLQREGEALHSWRTRPWTGRDPAASFFSPFAPLLCSPLSPSSWQVWLLESDLCQTVAGRPVFLPEGGWVNVGDNDLERWSNEGQRLDSRRLEEKLLGLKLSPAGYLVAANRQGVQLVGADFKQRIGSINIPEIHKFSLSADGNWLFVLHHDARLSVWSLPAGVRLGEPRAFDESDRDSLTMNSGHGWLLASAGGKCGCWHLGSGTFEWLDFPESWLEGVYPLAGGRVLLLTQGAWHLYSGPPLRRLASLRTTGAGGWIVDAADGNWDSSPELSSRIWVSNGPELQPAPTLHRQDSLWGALLAPA